VGMIKVAFIFIFCGAVFAQSQTDMEADLGKHPEHLSTRIQLANVYLTQKNFDHVIALLNPYTDQLPSQGFLALANAYSNKKKFDDEVRVLNLLIAKEPEDFHWHMLLGEAYLKEISQLSEGEFEKKKTLGVSAIQQFRQALKISPKFKPGFDILLATLLQQKANNEARELLDEGLRTFGRRPELYRELCRLDALDGYLDSAVTNCREGIKLAPNYPDNFVFLTQALMDQKEDQSAESAIVSAAKRFGTNEFVQWAAGTFFFKKKNYPVALRYFQAAVKADAHSARAHFGLAQSMFETGQEKESLPHFVFACKVDPSTVDIFLSEGGKLKQKGNSTLGDKFVQAAYACKG